MKSLARYLERRSVHGDWPIVWPSETNEDVAIVIPSFDEEDTLPLALDSLAAQPSEARARCVVICVVNNPPADESNGKRIEANQRTLAALRRRADEDDRLAIAIVDASSPGLTLSPKEGVGLARRIGMDHAVRHFADAGVDGVMLSFDADARAGDGYLEHAIRFFDANRRPSAVFEYEHSGDEAIAGYEIFLRYCVMGLKIAGSPYAFHTIGSAMGFRASAYAQVQGMPKKSAAEDFYLLQKLAKLGPMGYVPEAVVYPSSRVSDRVPFGTGAAMTEHAHGERTFTHLHDPTVYRLLRTWLDWASNAYGHSASDAIENARSIDVSLATFLEQKGLSKAWTNMQAHAASEEQFARSFHDWFDALATLRCIHHLRDCAYPDVMMEDALRGLLGDVVTPHCEDVHATLSFLRAAQRENSIHEMGS